MDFKEAKKRAAQLTKEIRHHNELIIIKTRPRFPTLSMMHSHENSKQ